MSVCRKIGVWFAASAVIAASLVYWQLLSADQHGTTPTNAGNLSTAEYRAIDSKVKLLSKLVNESAAATRISTSKNAQAQLLLANARAAWQEAATALESGELTVAEQQVKQGLQAMQSASGMVQDAGRVKLAQQQRYQELRKRVLSFSEAFQRAVAEKPGEPVSDYANLDEVSGLLQEAEDLAHNGDYVKANQRLAKAADDVELALSVARDKETLIHELKFESPEEEYAYEIQRNKGYQQLIDLLKQKRVGSDTRLVYVQKMIVENDKLCEDAEALVKKGDIQAAIRELEKGTSRLERALRASGVAF